MNLAKVSYLSVGFPLVISHFPFFKDFSVRLDLIFLADNFPSSNHPGMTMKFDSIFKSIVHGLDSSSFELLQVLA